MRAGQIEIATSGSPGVPGICIALGSRIFQYSISFIHWISFGSTRTATARSNAHENDAIVPLQVTVQFGPVISRVS